uniref:Uncharacterized protein n=1 Tax=Daphnia magna TaxID=35525 RepID=A0A0P5UD91_9CRUS
METSLELHVDPGNLAPVPIASMKGRILQPIGQFYNSLMVIVPSNAIMYVGIVYQHSTGITACSGNNNRIH